jgi:L-ascorbate metabolism protein UlaG (beta-lactamase superfamily)
MKIKWLGTAGFRVDTGNALFLIDPYLSRNPRSSPVQVLLPHQISGAGQIFISHGHFDHLSDVPQIMAGDTSCVYCSCTAAETLIRLGVNSNRICAAKQDGYSADFDGYRAQAFFSRHIKFDLPLIARTLNQIGLEAMRLLHMHSRYPMGQVLSWRFTIGNFTVQHFGSAGASRSELEHLAAMPLDLLLLPLQGHTRIFDVALEYVRILKPRMVIPHHQDNFYPPISTLINVQPFAAMVHKICPKTDVRQINDTLSL